MALIRTSKKSHYQNYFADNFKDIRKTWKGIKSIINIHNITKGQPSSMIINKELQSDPTKIANGFNDYFSEIALNLQQNIYPNGPKFTDYLKNSSEQSFF